MYFCKSYYAGQIYEAKHQVNAFTEQMRADGYHVLGEPRITGDGFLESVIAYPDCNRVELVAENN